MQGDTVVVGAFGEPSGAFYPGAAYVFVRSGATWSQQAHLTASTPVANESFGYAVAVSDDTFVVGAQGQGANQGAAYVFVRSGATWSQQDNLKPASTPGGLNRFGNSVAVLGDTIVIGAREESGGEERSGAVYVFVRSDTDRKSVV